MKNQIKAIICFLFVLLGFTSPGCRQQKANGKIDTYANVKNELKGVELSKSDAKADVYEFEMEVNNGGLNQYFLNAGQNCFETLRELQKTGKTNTATILQQAIVLINPNKLSEKALVNKLHRREVEELFDDRICEELNKLDESFFTYPDGALTDILNDKENVSH